MCIRDRPSPFLKTLRYILKDPERIKDVSDTAFNAVDTDHRGYIDRDELEAIMECVAKDMNISQPLDTNVDSMLKELGADRELRIMKEEFVRLIEKVLRKMEENETMVYNAQLEEAQS
eukprot:TRINITY_DN3941_c0_g2_i7.p1 TRINITY_DN3941_c0_g2~~TRINITY_DN3941_c0_g2_i7.p1  ORF type:complete len:118 (+),score=54.07 TRINITY_DN3941_c0_g2_i7:71-424(+)